MLSIMLALIIWLPWVNGNVQVNCITETFEDNSSITYCEESREGNWNLCMYARDEFGDLIFWECSPLYGQGELYG